MSSSVNRDALLAERARLLQRLAEIEAMLPLVEHDYSGDLIEPFRRS